MSDPDDEISTPEELKAALHRLREEHQDLSDAISALEALGRADQLQIRRLKRQKLHLKERIIQLKDQITPDIIA